MESKKQQDKEINSMFQTSENNRQDNLQYCSDLGKVKAKSYRVEKPNK